MGFDGYFSHPAESEAGKILDEIDLVLPSPKP